MCRQTQSLTTNFNVENNYYCNIHDTKSSLESCKLLKKSHSNEIINLKERRMIINLYMLPLISQLNQFAKCLNSLVSWTNSCGHKAFGQLPEISCHLVK